MNTIRRIRWWISHLFYINSRLGSISLNIAAISVVGVILSINANVIVEAANGGKMPVVIEAEHDYNITDRHVLADNTTNLRFLGDWIIIDQKKISLWRETPFITFVGKLLNFPLGKDIVASPGDVGMWIFISTGILALLLPFMCALGDFVKKIRSV